jgi:nucleoside-diphosphate-sugar epimerase
MQTIIGSGGAIGVPLAKELKKYTEKIRLVSRNPQKVNETDELFSMDANNLTKLNEAIVGSEVVYVTIGFKYNIKVWQSLWPPFMRTVINTCKVNNVKLVFFDNVYLYDKSTIPFMTENSPIGPPSKKGEVRKQLNEMIMNEVQKGSLTALIARSADFYGPDTNNSIIGEMVVKNLMKNKKAQTFGDINKIHTYTYTPDAGKATALLGNTADAYNQVWHVPTTKEKLTNQQWIDLIAEEMNIQAKIQYIPTWIIHMLGIFIPLMREFPEMVYQNKMDYVFDSSKFENRFGLTATAPKDGVKEMINYFKKINSGR